LANAIVDITGSDAEVIYNPRAKGGMSRMRADISRAKEILGYRPSVSLEKGLRLTIERDARFQR
ncbi:MAG: epimerase, partial [Chloroflexota bacterium]|nr:epimerase [Chloroflexota bacterium]